MQSQRNAVENAVLSVVGSYTSEFSKDQRSNVVDLVTDAIFNGEVEFSDSARSKYPTREDIRAYTVGMVSNWLRKSDTLNNGQKYQPKTTGRSRNPVLKQLELLKLTRATSLTAEELEAIENEISSIKSKSAVEKASKKTKITADSIDVSILPEHLRHLIEAV